MPGCKVVTVESVVRDGVSGILYRGEFIPDSDLYSLEEKAKFDGLDSLCPEERKLYLSERAEKAARTRWSKRRRI